MDIEGREIIMMELMLAETVALGRRALEIRGRRLSLALVVVVVRILVARYLEEPVVNGVLRVLVWWWQLVNPPFCLQALLRCRVLLALLRFTVSLFCCRLLLVLFSSQQRCWRVVGALSNRRMLSIPQPQPNPLLGSPNFLQPHSTNYVIPISILLSVVFGLSLASSNMAGISRQSFQRGAGSSPFPPRSMGLVAQFVRLRVPDSSSGGILMLRVAW